MSGVSQGMGVLDGYRLTKGKGQFWGKRGSSHCNQWGLCGVVLDLEEWLRRSSKITLGFLVGMAPINSKESLSASVAEGMRFQRSSEGVEGRGRCSPGGSLEGRGSAA